MHEKKKSENRKYQAQSLKLVKKMENNLKKFYSMKGKVEKTKAQQEEAYDSSGSEGYKLYRKYKNYTYVRMSL